MNKQDIMKFAFLCREYQEYVQIYSGADEKIKIKITEKLEEIQKRIFAFDKTEAISLPVGRRLDESEYVTEDSPVSEEEQREIDRSALSDSSYDNDDFSLEEENRW